MTGFSPILSIVHPRSSPAVGPTSSRRASSHGLIIAVISGNELVVAVPPEISIFLKLVDASLVGGRFYSDELMESLAISSASPMDIFESISSNCLRGWEGWKVQGWPVSLGVRGGTRRISETAFS